MAEICNTSGTVCPFFLVWLFMKHSRTEMVTMTSKILFPFRQQLEVAVVDGARALAVNTSRCKRDAFKLENISWHFANGKDEDDMGFHALQILASCSPGDTWTLLIWSVPQLFLRLQTSCWAIALGANDLKSPNWSISCKKNEEDANLVDDMPRNFMGENLQSAESARQVSAGIGSYLAGLEAKQKDSATVYSRFPS